MEDFEKYKIQKFIDTVERIKNSNFLNEAKKITYELKIVEGVATQEVRGFDEDHFRSFLLDFRKIYMVGEDTHYNYICNLICRYSQNSEIKKNVAECRKLYIDALKVPTIKMTINNKVEIPINIIDKWLNGNYFHENSYKKTELEFLTLALPFHKSIFIMSLISLAQIAIITSNNAKIFLKEINPI